MSVLKYLDMIIENHNGVDKENFCTTLIERINEIFKEMFKEDNYNIKISNNNIDILTEECSNTLKKFIKEAEPMIRNKQKIEDNIDRLNNTIKQLEKVEEYLGNKERLEGKKLSRSVDKVNRLFDDVSLDKDDNIILEQEDIIISYIEGAVENSKNSNFIEAGKEVRNALNSVENLKDKLIKDLEQLQNSSDN